jgi:hypothetical protein
MTTLNEEVAASMSLSGRWTMARCCKGDRRLPSAPMDNGKRLRMK